MTEGACCNQALSASTLTQQRKGALIMASKAVKVARAKFDKLAALNADIDVGDHIGVSALKAKSKMNDTWRNRKSNNVRGFFDQKKARAIKRGAVC
jgi:hypothetical protein